MNTTIEKDAPIRRGLIRGLVGLGTAGALTLVAAVPSWAATPAIDAVTDSDTTIVVDNATSTSGNVATVSTTSTGTNTWTATIEYTVTAPEGEDPGTAINLLISPDLDNAGFYAILGNVTDADWRPSDDADSSVREQGPAAWFNEEGDVSLLGSTVDDQYQYTPDEPVSNEFTVEIVYDATADEYTISGAAIGPDGETEEYELVSDEPIYQLYTVGALGTSADTPQLEQIVNVEFDL
ncbi:MAG: hypothetical protein QM604_01740 [Microbacterium sp.]